MKLILKTSTFILLSLLMVFTGKYINALYFEKNRVNDMLVEAESHYDEFLKSFDAGKKTIVVIGTSTSVLSFPANSEESQKLSYVDFLKNQTNALNLSSINLHYASEARVLIRFAQEKLPDSNLVILENLNYMEPLNVFAQSSELGLMAYCSKEYFKNKLADERTFLQTQCKQLIVDFVTDSTPWLTNPCLKKHNESINQAFALTSKERVKILTTVLNCNKGFFQNREVPLEIMDAFHFGHFEDLKTAFKVTNYHFDDFKEEEYSDKFSAAELVLTNYYLNEFTRDNKENRFLVLPTPARSPAGLSSLPVFKRENNNLLYVDISTEMAWAKFMRNLKFYDIFPDGSHSRIWVHELIADKIFPSI